MPVVYKEMVSRMVAVRWVLLIRGRGPLANGDERG